MNRPSLVPVIEQLAAWRDEVLRTLKTGELSVLDLKLGLDRAIRCLELSEQHQFQPGGEAQVLPAPHDYEPLGEYRILWDCETEERFRWHEVGRALPGDLIVRRAIPR